MPGQVVDAVVEGCLELLPAVGGSFDFVRQSRGAPVALTGFRFQVCVFVAVGPLTGSAVAAG